MEYEGLVKLVKHLDINRKDTFLDCGSGKKCCSIFWYEYLM